MYALYSQASKEPHFLKKKHASDTLSLYPPYPGYTYVVAKNLIEISFGIIIRLSNTVC